MTASPYWITPQLAIVPKPQGGPLLDAEMFDLRKAGIDLVVSMLQQDEARALDLAAEDVSAQKAGILFLNFPVPDGSVPPELQTFKAFLETLEEQIAKGRRVGVHCHGCIGRSAVVAASLLIRSGIPPENAWIQVETARGCPVPGTKEQRDWVDRNITARTPKNTPPFPQTWRADILQSAPLIAPARHFTYPLQIAGEEDALARGALQLLIHPATGGDFLATCALGFTDKSMPSAVFSCPNHDELCAVAGGYAYIIDTNHPEHSTHIPLKPTVEVLPVPTHNLILFAGFHTILAWSANGEAWHTQRLTWEGLKITSIEGNTLHGTGWNLLTDKEVPFTVDLLTGQHQGGGFHPPPARN